MSTLVEKRSNLEIQSETLHNTLSEIPKTNQSSEANISRSSRTFLMQNPSLTNLVTFLDGNNVKVFSSWNLDNSYQPRNISGQQYKSIEDLIKNSGTEEPSLKTSTRQCDLTNKITQFWKKNYLDKMKVFD